MTHHLTTTLVMPGKKLKNKDNVYTNFVEGDIAYFSLTGKEFFKVKILLHSQSFTRENRRSSGATTYDIEFMPDMWPLILRCIPDDFIYEHDYKS
jgi:hypothetical protein